MPRRDDLKRIVILGSGPIRIGKQPNSIFRVVRLVEHLERMGTKLF